MWVWIGAIWLAAQPVGSGDDAYWPASRGAQPRHRKASRRSIERRLMTPGTSTSQSGLRPFRG